MITLQPRLEPDMSLSRRAPPATREAPLTRERRKRSNWPDRLETDMTHLREDAATLTPTVLHKPDLDAGSTLRPRRKHHHAHPDHPPPENRLTES